MSKWAGRDVSCSAASWPAKGRRVHVCAHLHLSLCYLKGFIPCRRTHKLDVPTIRLLDGLLIIWIPLGATLHAMGFILAAWDCLEPHFGGLVDFLGRPVSRLARGPQNGLHCIQARAGALFYWDGGTVLPRCWGPQAGKVGGDLPSGGPIVN